MVRPATVVFSFRPKILAMILDMISEDKIGYRYSVGRYVADLNRVDGGPCGLTVDR